METSTVVCPVCTLYLRPGMTLKSHLASHPKQKVIEALVKLSNVEETENAAKYTVAPPQMPQPPEDQPSTSALVVNGPGPWNAMPIPLNGANMQGNQIFIYQQSMSTTTPNSPHQAPPNILNLNALNQPYLMPQNPTAENTTTVCNTNQQYVIFNPLGQQMMPYMYQQQQVIVSTGPPPLRPILPKMGEEDDEIKITEHISDDEEEVKDCQDVQDNESEDAEEKAECIESEIDKQEIEIPPPVIEINDDQYEEEERTKTATSGENWTLDCQTQTPNNHQDNVPEIDRPQYYYVNENQDMYNQNQQTCEPERNNMDYVDMDGMEVIIGGFAQTPIISQVENFDHSHTERPGVLMTIGEIVEKDSYSAPVPEMDESMSRESIRTDERMPPRGELSGQESLGGSSDITWNRLQYEGHNSGMSTSYDLMARESWEASNSSDARRLPEPHFEDDNDTPTIVSYSGPPLNFTCSTCGEAFANLKGRKEHEMEKHPEKISKNSLSSSTVKKKFRKIKPKPENEENNFVFTNKLKLEQTSEEVDHLLLTPNTDLLPDVKNDEMQVEMKAICSICDCVCDNLRALKLHRLEVHKVAAEDRHKCNTCGLTFVNEYKFTEHLKIHPLECRLCGKLFFRKQNFQLHMKRHLGLKPYKCEICQKCFVTKQKHDEHKNTHTGEAPIKCTLCDESFRRHSNLVQHRNRHHLNVKKKVRDYVCYCGEVFHTKKKFAWHKEIHDPKPKSCQHCNEKFIHMSSLTRHMRRAHNEKFLPDQARENENVECPICKGIYIRSSLDLHLRRHNGIRPYTCAVCNKDFTTKWNLKLHKWTHASRAAKPFKCDQCKGAFIRESDYISHMNSHKSVRPYTCNYCGAQFIRKYNCQRHVKEHENQKTFSCQVCGKSFHRSYYLKDHMRVHSGIRPYACNICGKTSTTKSNHNKHVQIHHAREPVSTEN